MRKYEDRQWQLAGPVDLRSFLVPGPQCRLCFDSERSYHNAVSFSNWSSSLAADL